MPARGNFLKGWSYPLQLLLICRRPGVNFIFFFMKSANTSLSQPAGITINPALRRMRQRRPRNPAAASPLAHVRDRHGQCSGRRRPGPDEIHDREPGRRGHRYGQNALTAGFPRSTPRPDGVISFVVAANETTEAREAVIEVSYADIEPTPTFKVKQGAPNAKPEITFAQESVSVPAEGGLPDEIYDREPGQGCSHLGSMRCRMDLADQHRDQWSHLLRRGRQRDGRGT